VRPGIIGEIGTDKPWVSALEERVHRAAARASLATGLAITTHAILSPVGLDQLRIFTEEGVDPGRVVIGHADSYPVLDHYLTLLGEGRYPTMRALRRHDELKAFHARFAHVTDLLRERDARNQRAMEEAIAAMRGALPRAPRCARASAPHQWAP